MEAIINEINDREIEKAKFINQVYFTDYVLNEMKETRFKPRYSTRWARNENKIKYIHHGRWSWLTWLFY